MKAVKNIAVEAKAIKETEKAIALEVCYLNKGNEVIATKWLPKSQITVSDTIINIPSWILRNVFTELNIGTYATIGNTSVCSLDLI